MEQPPKKDKTTYQYLELYSPKTGLEASVKAHNRQDNMSLLESSNPTTVGPEKCHIAEAQVKDLKIGLVNMLEVLKEEMSRLIKEIYENIDSKRKWRKQIKTCKWKKN